MITGLHQNLSDANYRPRQQLLSAAATTAGQVIQVTTSPTYFERAYFYGYKTVPNTGASPTPNITSVYVGETLADGTVFCVDEVMSGEVVAVECPPGAKLNLADFRVQIPTIGDRVFVKFQ